MFNTLPEIGHIFLIFATVSALFISAFGFYKLRYSGQNIIPLLNRGVRFIFVLTLLCVLTLAYLFYQDNFSVTYIAQHSNSQLPFLLKVTALWSGHEGSMLFWLFSLSLWSALFSCIKRISPEFKAYTLLILLGLYLLFAIFILGFSNPFLRLSPTPLDGRDLNPMLQDIAFVIHPPLLYLGYVGLAIPFAISLAALFLKKLPSELSAIMRPMLQTAWGFLTVGIVVGAYWAYYELGWGGFWFWDPVENASLLPWLMATALLHLIGAHERKGLFPYWVIFLGLIAFCFSVLGTFIVRSGIISSVHAFAVSPSRAFALLIVLNLVIMIALSFFVLRAKIVRENHSVTIFSVESALLAFSLVMIFLTFVVIIGTFYPLILNLLNLNSVSVGAPYFNRFFLLSLVIVLLLLIGLPKLIARQKMGAGVYGVIFVLSTALTYLLFKLCALPLSAFPFLLIFLSVLVIISHSFLAFLLPINMSRLVMIVAHSGLAISIIGGSAGQFYHYERHVLLAKNEPYMLLNYQLILRDVENIIGTNFTAERAMLDIYNTDHKTDNKLIGKLTPEKRHYSVRGTEMSEVSLISENLSDLYALLGEKRGTDRYTFKLQYKPLINLLWLGLLIMLFALFMRLGGLLFRRKSYA